VPDDLSVDDDQRQAGVALALQQILNERMRHKRLGILHQVVPRDAHAL